MLQLAIVVAAPLIAWATHLHVNLIPKFLFRYQQGFYSPAEVRLLVVIFVAVHVVILGAARLLAKGGPFDDARSFARELFLLLAATSVASLVVFIFTTVFFDPNYFAVTFAVTALLHLLVFLARSPDRSGLVPGLLRTAWSPLGVAVLLVAVSPVLLALQFKRDKDFANSINAIRLYFNSRELDWALVDVYPSLHFLQPIEIGFTPAEPDATYVLERDGRIFRVSGGAEPRKDLLLDFSTRVGPIKLENGALGFALHPRFGQPGPQAGYVYVYYTDATQPQQMNRVSRFDLALPNAAARLASETPLIEQPRNSSGYHNGGAVRFGPDGFLYVGIGDALDGSNHQTITKALFAGIFRIDVDERGGTVSHPPRPPVIAGSLRHYMVPSDNPFVGRDGTRDEFWALGLRNPFRFAFDRETGRIWAGDVGAEQFEEVDFIEKGGNYQFPYMEGFLRHGPTPSPLIGTERPPVLAYAHTAFERAVIGGVVYRGARFPELVGQYVFADNTSGHLHAIPADPSGRPERGDLARIDLLGYLGISSIAESPQGDILVVVLGSRSQPTGRIMRVEKKSALAAAGITPDETPVERPSATTMEEIKVLWLENCSRCHGLAGRGDAEGAEVRPPDFAERAWQSKRTDAQIADVIARGGGAAGLDPTMPAWEGALTPGEIELLVKLVRSFGQ